MKHNKNSKNIIDIAKKTLCFPYVFDREKQKTIKRDELSLWALCNVCEQEYEECITTKFLWATIRKTLIDNFCLEDYYLFEIPVTSSTFCVAVFCHKGDCDSYHLNNKDVDIREISFEWNGDSLYATPVKVVYDDDSGLGEHIEVKTCQEAVTAS